MSRSPRLRKLRHCLLRWLVPGALIALAPKCVLCLAAYLGLGAALGLTGTEICGAPDSATLPTALWFLAGASAVGLILWLRMKAASRERARPSG